MPCFGFEDLVTPVLPVLTRLGIERVDLRSAEMFDPEWVQNFLVLLSSLENSVGDHSSAGGIRARGVYR